MYTLLCICVQLSQSADFDTDAADSEVWSIYENYTIVIDAAAQSSLRDLVEDQKKGTNSAGLNILADDTVALGGEAGISDATEFECASDSVGSDCTPTTGKRNTTCEPNTSTSSYFSFIQFNNFVNIFIFILIFIFHFFCIFSCLLTIPSHSSLFPTQLIVIYILLCL